MKKTSWPAIAVLLLAVAPALAADPAKKAMPPMKADAVTVNASEIAWGEPPPEIPKGAQMGVLHGDPSKKEPFTLRLKLPNGYQIPAHWHTNDEQLTVLSGTFVLHMGDAMDAPAQNLEAGAYHFLPGKMHHAAEAKGETVVQIDGMGPFDIHYVDPADNPHKAMAPAN